MQFHGLETNFYSWRVHVHDTTLNIHIWKKRTLEGQCESPDLPGLSAPYPSVWSENWERKHLKPVLDNLGIYILSKFNPK